jgi:hypothetical protein
MSGKTKADKSKDPHDDTSEDHSWKLDALGEWNSNIDPKHWVPGDPLPGRWRDTWAASMVSLADSDECDGEHCWCTMDQEIFLSYMPGHAFRWSPHLPQERTLEDLDED